MKPVRLYTTKTCPYCRAAKDLLRRKGVDYEEIDVTGNDALRARMTEEAGGLRTVPQIWIGARHVGGYSDLAELDARGELDGALDESGDEPRA